MAHLKVVLSLFLVDCIQYIKNSTVTVFDVVRISADCAIADIVGYELPLQGRIA